MEGKSIMLVGKNARGKSSFLQAINIALGLDKEIPANPITNGMKEGEIQVLTDDNGRKIEFSVRMREGKDPIVSARIEGEAKITEKKIIHQIVGGVDFDIFEFVELSRTKPGKRKQVEIIKSYLPAETIEALDALKKKVADKIEERKAIKRDIATYEGFVAQSPIMEGEISKYAEKKDISELQAKYDKAVAVNNRHSEIKGRIEQRKNANSDIEKQIEDFEAQIAALRAKQESFKAKIEENIKLNSEAEKWLQTNEMFDISSLQKELKEASEFNIKVSEAATLKQKVEKLSELRSQHEDIDIFVKSSSSEIEEFIKSSPLPVPELTFNEDAIFYKNVEVDESSLSTSEIILLGARLKIAQNPKAKILTVARCESLDEDKINELIKFANQYDFQLLLECVDRKQEELKIEFIPEV